MRRGALEVTTSALNAVLEACGRLHQLDRTFATFDDIRHVFDLTPDLMSYNALLLACAQPRAPQAGESGTHVRAHAPRANQHPPAPRQMPLFGCSKI